MDMGSRILIRTNARSNKENLRNGEKRDFAFLGRLRGFWREIRKRHLGNLGVNLISVVMTTHMAMNKDPTSSLCRAIFR
jgi:hypothetical protein